MDCLFCKIIAGDIPSKKAYEDDMCLAFHDIAPQAPVHVLVIPKEHIPSADGVDTENSKYVSHIFEVIPKVAASLGLQNGYRVITNCGEDGCQSVKHLHFHILGGKKLPENMG
ncbi:MAG: histidine triad nucleotide-binding protein [Clostridia bacterium]|nr:histidine triad nucleotide-binding protein [Clostridia bacterium]